MKNVLPTLCGCAYWLCAALQPYAGWAQAPAPAFLNFRIGAPVMDYADRARTRETYPLAGYMECLTMNQPDAELSYGGITFKTAKLYFEQDTLGSIVLERGRSAANHGLHAQLLQTMGTPISTDEGLGYTEHVFQKGQLVLRVTGYTNEYYDLDSMDEILAALAEDESDTPAADTLEDPLDGVEHQVNAETDGAESDDEADLPSVPDEDDHIGNDAGTQPNPTAPQRLAHADSVSGLRLTAVGVHRHLLETNPGAICTQLGIQVSGLFGQWRVEKQEVALEAFETRGLLLLQDGNLSYTAPGRPGVQRFRTQFKGGHLQLRSLELPVAYSYCVAVAGQKLILESLDSGAKYTLVR